MIAYKLFRIRKDGTLGTLFIDRTLKVPTGLWLQAKEVPTKGYAFRPGFHACSLPVAPHLSLKDRAWFEVMIDDYQEFPRPENQGGMWFIARFMKVLRQL